MKPIRTPETNAVFTAAEGDEEDVFPLPVEVRGPGIHSTWELSDEEREMIAEGGVIEMGVAAKTPPPVGLAVAAPISDDGERMEWSPELKTFVRPVVEP